MRTTTIVTLMIGAFYLAGCNVPDDLFDDAASQLQGEQPPGDQPDAPPGEDPDDCFPDEPHPDDPHPDEPYPDPGDCEEAFFDCVEATDDPELCEPLLWACWDEHPDEPYPDEPYPDEPYPDEPWHFCIEAFEDCLQSGEPPELCEEILMSCEEPYPDDPGEPHPEDVCIEDFELCLQSGEPPELCEEILIACEPYPCEPDPDLDEPAPRGEPAPR